MGNRMIKVEHISKEYRLGVIGKKTRMDKTDGLLQGEQALPEIYEGRINEKGMLMALSDVSFEVDAGETLGIIGPNGAGKSTLLKLLTKITRPSTGRIFLNGQVASMIEVGTGFHPELTGRENIYLNGAVLGMSMREIERKLEEIIDFSECRMFIDTPVKRYSSGMYLKLGFSVAAFLDAEIVIMDEVLAVGDAAFQNKCIQKIREIAQSGRTILFVSHNMNTVRSLCSRCIVLDQGKLQFDGEVESAIQRYVLEGLAMDPLRDLEHQRRTFHKIKKMAHMTRIDLFGRTTYEMGEVLRFRLCFRALRILEQPCLRVGVWSADGTAAAISFARLEDAREGEHEVRVCVDISRLLPGKYRLELLLVEMDDNGRMVKQDALRNAAAFEVAPSKNRPVYQAYNRDWGYVELPMSVEQG